MVGDIGPRVELFAEEQDACAVVLEVAEAAGGRLQCLDAAVEAFRGRIGDPVSNVRQQVRQSALEHRRDLLHQCQSTTRRPAVPQSEEPLCRSRLTVFPGPAELLADGAGARRLQLLILESGELVPLLVADVLRSFQPRKPAKTRLLDGDLFRSGHSGEPWKRDLDIRFCPSELEFQLRGHPNPCFVFWGQVIRLWNCWRRCGSSHPSLLLSDIPAHQDPVSIATPQKAPDTRVCGLAGGVVSPRGGIKHERKSRNRDGRLFVARPVAVLWNAATQID